MPRALLCFFVLLAGTVYAATAEEQLLQADRGFNLAIHAKLADGLGSYLADNAVVPSTPPLAGKQAIVAFYRKVFADPDFSISSSTIKAEVFAGGKMGYTVGGFVSKFKNRSGQLMEQEGTYITVWKKQEDGSWKIIEHTGGESGPPHPAK